METTFGPEETIKASELRSGDFVVIVPTQQFGRKKIRGMRFEGLVEVDMTPDYQGGRSRPLGDHYYTVPVKMRKSVWYEIPSFFDVVVRREVAA
jgi:hypothetical protein